MDEEGLVVHINRRTLQFLVSLQAEAVPPEWQAPCKRLQEKAAILLQELVGVAKIDQQVLPVDLADGETLIDGKEKAVSRTWVLDNCGWKYCYEGVRMLGNERYRLLSVEPARPPESSPATDNEIGQPNADINSNENGNSSDF